MSLIWCRLHEPPVIVRSHLMIICFFNRWIRDEEANDIYLFLGEFFAEEVGNDEDETPDIKRRRVIYVSSSDEEEPNEEPSDKEEPALNDGDYYDSEDCPKCYQHLLKRCECLPPFPRRADDEFRMPFGGQWV